MENVGLVEGRGWISDESDFYGDEVTRSTLEKKATRKLKRPPQEPLERVSVKKPKLAETSNMKEIKTPKHSSVPVLDFLKSRPQIRALQDAAAVERKPAKKQPARTASGDEAADLLKDDRFRGDPAAWQQHETVHTFLKRAPVADPNTASLGPWLWVSNPKLSWSQKKHQAKTDVGALIEGGTSLLEAFKSQKVKVERSKPEAPPGTITRAMKPYREQLEEDLLALAVKTGTTCGKWMLFPATDDLPRYWRLVAEATAEGKLGPTSKAATYDPSDPLTLICVYTYDFTDTEDVRRVLEALVDLGVCNKSKYIYYKCDAYTYLGLNSDNAYKIRASLYSSKEILENEAKAKQDGPIVRLKKRNQAIDSFFSS
ncbi:hypothetical protein LTR37_001075 [Vermiconidia calcicola]|uniref:Uncharacterized protein n=1 Tax=Vermiconidia calcicola TaxID=1690605 RepID=A0ACC3NX39_9PEZI|nr:hypothetical protein LTR37_001075 [Vermiconidia calcicola]